MRTKANILNNIMRFIDRYNDDLYERGETYSESEIEWVRCKLYDLVCEIRTKRPKWDSVLEICESIKKELSDFQEYAYEVCGVQDNTVEIFECFLYDLKNFYNTVLA